MRYLIYILFSQILFLKTFAQGNFDKYGVNVDVIAGPGVTASSGGIQLFYNSSTDNNYKFKILARISRNNKGKSDQYAEFTWLRLKYVTNGNTYVIADDLILFFVADGLNQSPYKEFLIEIPSTIQTDGQIIGEFYTRNGAAINEVKNINTPLVTKIMSGPSVLCSEGIYTLGGPDPVSLENSIGIATLTSLGNNQYKITRNGTNSGTIKLRSSTQGKTFDKTIYVGGGMVTDIQGPDNVNGGHLYVLEAMTDGGGTVEWEFNSPYINPTGVYMYNQFEFYTSEILQNQKNLKITITAKCTGECGTVTYKTKTLTLNP